MNHAENRLYFEEDKVDHVKPSLEYCLGLRSECTQAEPGHSDAVDSCHCILFSSFVGTMLIPPLSPLFDYILLVPLLVLACLYVCVDSV